jgi:F-type H+-transporting ATPase subunit alpha
VIYAGVHGYLDPIPVNRIRAFEDGLLGTLRNQHPDVLNEIRDARDLSAATEAKLKSVVDVYAKAFA